MTSRIAQFDDLLGVLSDCEIARLTGVSQQVVQRRRTRKRIKAAMGPHSKKGIDWDREPLGRDDPRTIAGRLGVSVPAVYSACYSRGINPTAWRVQAAQGTARA